MKLSEKNQLAVSSLICLIYVLLRLWNLTDSCLWFDEIFSIHAAQHDWRNLFWFIAQDLIHPPLFYAVLKIWIALGGESLFWLRFFPVFFSALALLPFILLCRQLKLSQSAICLALMFFAVNGSLVKYAQEVRMYSLLLCLGLFSLWLFARFLNHGKSFPLLIIVNILLVYSHYFGWLIIASEILAGIILAREKLKQIFLLLVLTVVSFLPWLYALWQAMQVNSNVGQNIGWMQKPGFLSIFRFVSELFQPFFFEQSSADQNLLERIITTVIALLILAVGGVAFGFYFAEWTKRDEIEKRNFSLLLIFTASPVVLAFAASWILPYSIWGTRHLIIVFPLVAILSAIALSKIKFPQLRRAALILIFSLVGAAFLFQATRSEPKYIWCAWENLASELTQANNQPAQIYAFEDLVAYHFWFALRDSDGQFQVVKINDIDGLIEDKAYFLPRGFDAVQIANQLEGERFFIAFRDKNWNEFAPPLQNLKMQGYKFGVPQVYEAQGLKAFLVEVQK